MNNEIVRAEQPKSWLQPTSIDDAMKLAEFMAKAEDMCPKAYRGKPNAIFMAMVKAQELNLGISTVMENNYPIEGSLAWKSTFLIQYANKSGQLKGVIKFRWKEEGKYTIPKRPATPDIPADPNNGRKWPTKGKPEVPERIVKNISCTAYATLASGEEVEGPEVSVETAHHAGWIYNNPTQWLGDTRNMLYQRAAKRFCNMYGIGINELSAEEIQDSEPQEFVQYSPAQVIDSQPLKKAQPIKTPTPTPAKQEIEEVQAEPIPSDDAAQFEALKAEHIQLSGGDAEWMAAINAATTIADLEEAKDRFDL
jgi:hypothetical protein